MPSEIFTFFILIGPSMIFLAGLVRLLDKASPEWAVLLSMGMFVLPLLMTFGDRIETKLLFWLKNQQRSFDVQPHAWPKIFSDKVLL